jgi:hypothetical protein
MGDEDNISSSGEEGNDHDFHLKPNEQQQEEGGFQDDNSDNIGKWEEQNKENEINELESLDFSVKREEFAAE